MEREVVICEIQSDSLVAMANCIAGPRRRPAVLVSEDHEDVLAAITLLLKGNGFDTVPVKTPAEALSAFGQRSFDAVLLDLNYNRDTTSGAEGLELLRKVQEVDSSVPIVVMTAWATIELAVEAMHRGASDFVQKPWDNKRLVEVLREQIERAEKARETRSTEQLELEEAAQIQRALLPEELATLNGLTVAAASRSLRKVSGDLYDVIKLDEQRVAICIADVMGKGVGAALLMSNLQATIRMLAPHISESRQMCRRLNEIISSNDFAGKFITLFYAVVDLAAMRITYTNAGHNWPILTRLDGTCERLRTEDGVLGMVPNWTYHQGEVALRSGDRLILFTDGIPECADAAGNEFGEEALGQLVGENSGLSAQQVAEKIMASVRSYGNGSFADDATLLVADIG
jgi:phosphoserine phosphatase RsbU/P